MRILSAFEIFRFFVFLFAFAFTVAGQQTRPLQVEDAILAKKFPISGDFGSLSPDGRWLAYAVADSRRENSSGSRIYTKTGVPRQIGNAALQVVNTQTGDIIEIAGPASWAPSWSPDGSFLAFYSDKDGAARLWLWDKNTKSLHRASNSIVRPIIAYDGPAWMPDGKSIVAKVLPDGMTVQEANARGLPENASTRENDKPDGPSVQVFSWPQVEKVSENVSDEDAIVHINRPRTHEASSDLAIIDVKSGRIRRLFKDVIMGGCWPSPDGTMLACSKQVGRSRNSLQPYYDLLVTSLVTGESGILSSLVRMQFGRSVCWAPDGSTLAYTTSGTRAKGDVYVVDPEEGKPRLLTRGTHPNFGNDYRPPLWAADGNGILTIADDQLWHLPLNGEPVALTPRTNRRLVELVPGRDNATVWSRDGGKSVYLGTRDDLTKRVGWARVNIGSGRFVQLVEEDKRYGGIFQRPLVSADGNHVAFIAESADQEPNVWFADSDFASPRQMTQVTKALDSVVFGKSRVIEYRNGQGQILEGILLLPSNYETGKKYPMLVHVYPGPYKHSNKLNVFGIEGNGFSNMQILATRGYAVLVPEIPQRVGTPMQDLADGTLAAVNKVVELGVADPDRLGVFGHSYGGYATISLISQTSRFKAALMSAGKANLISGYGAMLKSGDSIGVGWSTGQGLMSGTPWEYRNQYIENSPIFYLDRVTTPLLIVHGTEDGVPVSQGDEIFVGLRRLNKVVEYRRYEGEGHVIQGYANMIDYWNAALRWFDKYLKAPEKAEASKQ